MVTKEDIEHLGQLARVGLSEAEKTELVQGIDAVLGYVSKISNITTDKESTPRAASLRNILREDVDAYQGGEWTEEVLANAPSKEDGYFKVEQIM